VARRAGTQAAAAATIVTSSATPTVHAHHAKHEGQRDERAGENGREPPPGDVLAVKIRDR
jgi:hypothetical protein